ncbi:MAG TPA: hypothetical protein VFM46_04120 [Pseudomonadales bacterium]|nr:hypothetical protein [Pseudomonadales bacterium]
MKNWQLKLLASVCAFTSWGSAQASSPLNWQVGVNVGQRGWDSPGYLDQKINFNVASISVSTGFEKYFASALYETSLGEKSIELAIDDSKLNGFPTAAFPNSGAGNAKRNEFSLVGGYNFTANWSGFVGYVTSEVDISNLSQLTYSNVSNVSGSGSSNATLIFLNGGVNYSSRGPFVGIGYRFPVQEYGAVSLSAAYAHLTAEGDVGSNTSYVVQNYDRPNGGGWTLRDNQTYPRDQFPSKSSSANGFSFGASWFGKIASEAEWLKTLRYVVSAKLYKYDYNGAGIVPSQTNTDSRETYTVLTFGLTKTF